MNLLGQPLRPVHLIANKLAIKDPDSPLMSDSLVLYWTPKCCQNSLSMASYVREIRVPYCQNLRNVMHDSMPPICLIMDNCSSHTKPELLALYALDNIDVIELPLIADTLCNRLT
jgi:hypothetical protein